MPAVPSAMQDSRATRWPNLLRSNSRIVPCQQIWATDRLLTWVAQIQWRGLAWLPALVCH
jgi:hypothetical protein